MISERFRALLWKKESLPIQTDETVDDLLSQFYGEHFEDAVPEQGETVDTFLDRAKEGAAFQASISEVLSTLSIGGQSVLSLFGHGGALCAHCVASVGSTVGNVSQISLPGIGAGHWHGDTWHAEDHDEDTSKHTLVHTETQHAQSRGPVRPSSHEKKKIDITSSRDPISVSVFVSSWFCRQALTSQTLL